MIKVIGFVVLILGGVLVFQGLSRKDSLLGEAAEVGTDVANKVDGGGRVPDHFIKIGGGAVLIVVGAVLAFRRVG
jgi:hypothetical protein